MQGGWGASRLRCPEESTGRARQGQRRPGHARQVGAVPTPAGHRAIPRPRHRSVTIELPRCICARRHRASSPRFVSNINRRTKDATRTMEEKGEEVVVNYEGIHFLAALDGASNHSDDVASWNSSMSESEEDESSSPPSKKFRSHIKWQGEEVSTVSPIPYTGDPGLRFTIENSEPMDFFNFFFKPDFLSEILDATNRYGKELQSLEVISFGIWKPISMPELHTFFGLVYHTGTIRMNNLSDYWSLQKLFDFKIFRTSMSMSRFVRILTALRFNISAVQCDDNEHKADSVEPLMTYFNSVMESICYPGRELVIDNCQVITDNTIAPKEGFNAAFWKPEMFLHSLSEPNGLVHKVVISDTMSGSTIVKTLMDGKMGRGHSLFLDKSYCSAPIVSELLQNRTYCTGILDSKNVPEGCQKRTEKGSTVVRFSEPGMCFLQWRGREEIFAISSEFRSSKENHVDTTCNKRRPIMVREYRKTVREMERKEFFASYKPLESKNLSWYRSLGLHILQLMMKNSYLLFNNNVRKMNFHEFRLAVIESLLLKTKADLLPPNLPLASDQSLHVPKKFPKREGQRSLRKRCKVCLREGKRTDSYYHCPQCPNQPALCLDRCFAEYHSSLKLKVEDNGDGKKKAEKD
ncbi:hypothetical protein GE061_019800 [Apolygus lucorum]|uniref:PiggyBac transposable element-derived protein domain-containing protein n=1 Tax=Apolygus lucorum TaxID=248454 RepID=A0A8S9X9F2_APOLU|nr:hypothetical protein GE061_019800 [Apolygus lucorum]